jgi:hypothetical protein
VELNSKVVPMNTVVSELRKLAKAGVLTTTITLHPENINVVTLHTVSDDTGSGSISDKPDRSLVELLHDM